MASKRYTFESPQIRAEQAEMKGWLLPKGYADNTVRQYLNYTGFYLQWVANQSLSPAQVSYAEMLRFMAYSEAQGQSRRHINRTLSAIRLYYQAKDSSHHPASGLFMRGVPRRLPHDLLDKAALDQLYESYAATDERTKRNKVILGLLVYQGLTTEELHQLEPSHLRLREGKLYVPGSRRRNRRVLKLEGHQVLDWQEYLQHTRPQLLADIFAYRSGRKPKQVNMPQLEGQLLMSQNGSEILKNSLLHLFKALRKLNPAVKDAKQIRASVLTHWLSSYDIRLVQYMAGHRYVSSTERYQACNLADLQATLNQHHPLQ